jgi:flagellar biosynthesis chaperone FliJ
MIEKHKKNIKNMNVLLKIVDTDIDHVKVKITECLSHIHIYEEQLSILLQRIKDEIHYSTLNTEVSFSLTAYQKINEDKINTIHHKKRQLENHYEGLIDELRTHYTTQKAYESVHQKYTDQFNAYEQKNEREFMDDIGMRLH